ncbi:hypothetical protein TIFTF001_016425 [Ficus carica]|uniref:MULE transposase domain-containing protein n=1 Tax=Ficus carica TaxID=3494 RepID=A0AA88A340_FICCA|nr:hypothetical protein TIFTF001_016425 [Ficus carica]
MVAVCVFIKYNGYWDGTLRHVGGEIKGILMRLTTTYVGLIELCDADVNFYIQLKKKDVHVLSKFPISIDVLDESVAEAIPPEVGESNHIDMQPSRDCGQSMDHDDCNAGELNVADAVCDSNEKSIAASVGAHSIVNTTRTQSIHGPSSDSFSGSAVVADFTPITMHNERYPWQLRATRMKGSELFVVKRYDDVHTYSIEIIQGHHWKEAALTSIRGDDAESYRVLPARGEMVKRKNPSSDIHIETDSENSLKYFYMCLAASKQGWPHCRPVIVVDGSALKTRFGGMLLAACGHDANGSIFPLAFGTQESLAIVADRHKGIDYATSIVYLDADFGICVQHLAANLKMRYKDFKGLMKAYFDGASMAYLVSEHQRHMESI